MKKQYNEMSSAADVTGSPLPGRINSIDFYRGLTMFLLAGESTHVFSHFLDVNHSFIHFLALQFHHHDWHGLRFWDLIQPFFMFIVVVSIPFAVANRLKKGHTERLITMHAIKRSFILLLLGWAVYCILAGKIVWQFQNVLAQLSVTYLVAFLIRNKSYVFQIIFTLFVLLVIDLAYRFFPVEGFNHPWVNYENLGAWVNNKIEGVDKTSEWASLNAISTTAHTVWGVLCGKLLMSHAPAKKKIQALLMGGCRCTGHWLFLGFIKHHPYHQENSNFIFCVCKRRMGHPGTLLFLLAG